MHINFATKKSFDLKALKEFKFNRMVLLVATVATLFTMICCVLIQKVRLNLLVEERANIERAVSAMKDKGGRLILLEGSFGKEAIFEKYEKRVLWSDILKNVANGISSNVWLSAIKNGQNSDKIDIDGEAADQMSVADMVKSLQDVNTFSSVRLVDSLTSEKDGKNKIAFKVQCRTK